MAHHAAKSGYAQLTDRLNQFPQGAPPTELLFKILSMLFSEREATLVSMLPIRPFTAETAARLWKTTPAEARKTLDELASRAILLDMEDECGRVTYVLPPPMAGFFEFSMMRVRGDIDQKLLAELFYQYLNVEEEFIRALFTGETKPGRVFVQEAALSPENALRVLDYERASEVIRSSPHMAIGVCYCRHKMHHKGMACDAPMEICMTFGACADSLARHGIARRVDKAEGLELLAQAWERNLVQFSENAREGVSFICNCCGCCCEAMIAARRLAVLHPIETTNFLPDVDSVACNGCGRCASACPVEAMTLVSANNPHKPAQKKARLNEEVCLGCAVCVRTCPSKSISLRSRAQRVITPVNGAHRIVSMAIERGKLQNLIFDQQALASHRAMAAILGVILELPPMKQILASRQVKSRYLEALITRVKV